MDETQESNEVVIVKVKRFDPEEDGAHAGTWKIAYADFVTAMMAFFLLMWLINATSQEQRDGISAYFNPVALATAVSGSDGLMSGRTADTEGAMSAPNGEGERPHPVSSPPTVSTLGPEQNAPQGQSGGTQVESLDAPYRSPFDHTAMADSIEGDKRYSGVSTLLGSTAFQDPFEKPEAKLTADWARQGTVTENDLPNNTALAEAPRRIGLETRETIGREDRNNSTAFAEAARQAGLDADEAIGPEHLNRVEGQHRMELVKAALAEKLERLLAEKNLQSNVQMDVGAEGLRIQITDDNDFAMFEIGSHDLNQDARELLIAVGSVLEQIPNGIIITGHTDARPYAAETNYGNWELATDRANAARRALVEAGLDRARIRRVEGYGDRALLVPDDPYNPRNRRISILVFASEAAAERDLAGSLAR
jgi:chemotaxis protein MotB